MQFFTSERTVLAALEALFLSREGMRGGSKKQQRAQRVEQSAVWFGDGANQRQGWRDAGAGSV